MLLYSTTLKVKNTLKKDDFIKLVIEWNQTSPRKYNRIPDISWNGEYNIRYENENLWLQIEEYRNENIIAVRFEKRDNSGAIWDTDYVVNFNEWELTVQLERSYTEAQIEYQFSSPHFIKMLIDEGCLEEDNKLPVLQKEIAITQDNLNILIDVINGNGRYRLPVVYVSKTATNDNPIDVKKLSKKLRGIAHVLVQENTNSNQEIRTACEDKNEYLGGIGIYFPNNEHRRYVYRSYDDRNRNLINVVSQSIFDYMNAQNKQGLSTWYGVQIALLSDQYLSKKVEIKKALQAKQEAEDAVGNYIDTFDADYTKAQQRIQELTNVVNSLKMENQGLRKKLNASDNVPILYLGDEEEFFQGEIKEMILDCVHDKFETLSETCRRKDVFNDILKSNNYQCIHRKTEQSLNSIFKGYKTLTDKMRQQLKKLGIKITGDNNHFVLTYYGDKRYQVTIAKSASDNRAGKNDVKIIMNKMM